jgi:hypothetical protein
VPEKNEIKPEFWQDLTGKWWKVPEIKGRLKTRIPCHKALIEFVIKRDGTKCKFCGNSNKLELIADHILSRRNGGDHHPDNMQCLCQSCNSRKANLIDRTYSKNFREFPGISKGGFS